MNRLLTKKEAAWMAGSYHPETLMRMVRERRFPKPIRLSGNKIAFVETEVLEWIEARIAERDAAQ